MAQALGIEDRSNYGDLQDIEEGEMLDFIRQLHKAVKAGTHHDIRLGSKKHGLYSWATRKDMPTTGKAIQLFRQPLHTHKYKEFEGSIPVGEYGGGTVKKEEEVKALITRKNDHISFTTSEQVPRRFALIPGKGRDAMLVRKADPIAPGVKKPHFKTVPRQRVSVYVSKLSPEDVVQPKIDGALSLFHILRNKDIEVLSHRTSKRSGGPIFHTERFFGRRPKLKTISKDLTDTVLLGEMYGEKDGKAIPVQTLGGLLNSKLDKSLRTQRMEGIKLKAMLFDIHKLNGRDTTKLPYAERLKLVEKIKPMLNHPEKFELPESVKGPEAGKTLLDKIQSGKHPLTVEGLVVRKPSGETLKAKLFTEHDVYIRDIFPGEGKYAGKAAGGFDYSLKPEGPIVGKCGTGLDDALRKDMWENPQTYLGRVARIHSQGQYKDTGAYRVPSLIAIHESK